MATPKNTRFIMSAYYGLKALDSIDTIMVAGSMSGEKDAARVVAIPKQGSTGYTIKEFPVVEGDRDTAKRQADECLAKIITLINDMTLMVIEP
jgi:hypothetical protein